MGTASMSKSAVIRARLNHPIIDSDGHSAEFEQVLFDYLKDVGGSRAVERLLALPDSPFSFRWYKLTPPTQRFADLVAEASDQAMRNNTSTATVPPADAGARSESVSCTSGWATPIGSSWRGG